MKQKVVGILRRKISTRKSLLVIILCVLPVALLAQTAREESVSIYGDIEGSIFYNETFFVNDPASPVQISVVEARHVPLETAEMAELVIRELGRYEQLATQMDLIRELTREQLRITIGAEGNDVVAVKFAVIAYDAFNEHLGGLTAVTMDPPQDEMEWNFSPAYLFKFRRYGVVGVYVQQARLRNGEIWNFDSENVLTQFRDYRNEITLDQLRVDEVAD